jgi:hypothetical protein
LDFQFECRNKQTLHPKKEKSRRKKNLIETVGLIYVNAKAIMSVFAGIFGCM